MKLSAPVLAIFILTLLCAALCSCQGCGDDDDDDNDGADDDDSAAPDDDTFDDDADDDVDDDVDDDADDDNCDDYEDPIQAGRDYLKAGIPELAVPAFECALLDDESSSDAHYGITLAGGLHIWELVSLISVMISDYDSGHDPAKDIDPVREMLRQIAAVVTEGLIHPSGENVREHSMWLTENGDPAFMIEDIPVLWELRPLALLGSEFDAAEKEACVVLANVFDGIGGILISMKIDTNIARILDMNFTGEIPEIIASIVELLDELLNDPVYPDMFKIDEDYMDRIAESRLHLGDGLTALNRAVEAIKSETDSQEDDVLAYVDQNANGAYDDGEPFDAPSLGLLEGQDLELLFAVALIAEDLGASILDRSEMDVDPANANPFHVSSINELLNVYGIPSLIPDFITVDVASYFENLEPDSIRDLLQSLVDILKIYFPAAAA